jgi:hypothetical protein
LYESYMNGRMCKSRYEELCLAYPFGARTALKKDKVKNHV